MTPEELRASMRAAQPSQRGAYVEAGRHTFEIDKALCKRTTFDGKTKESYILELRVLASTTHEVGSTVSYIENPDNAGWLGRFKSALIAICGLDPSAKLSSQDEDTVGNIIACLRFDEERVRLGWPENFLKGRQVACEGTPGKSRGGSPVTNKKWAPVVAPAQAGA